MTFVLKCGAGLSGKCTWNHSKNKKMTNHSQNGQQGLSTTFAFLAVFFCICLVSSNIFASKLFTVFGVSLSGAVIIFPVSYILNDCIAEIYGYRKAMMVIWTGFAMNFFFVLMSQLVIMLPPSPFWDGKDAFDTVLGATPRAAIASLLAFLAGSTINAAIMSRMKVADQGKRFSLRAIVSSVAGELSDSVIFVPIMFWSIGLTGILSLIATQVIAKVAYEIIILPVTKKVITTVKSREGIDHFDTNISYNPFKLKD